MLLSAGKSAAQTADMHIDCSGLYVDSVIPDSGLEFVAAHGFLRSLKEVTEQLELYRTQMNVAISTPDPIGRQIHFHVAIPHFAVDLLAFFRDGVRGIDT